MAAEGECAAPRAYVGSAGSVAVVELEERITAVEEDKFAAADVAITETREQVS